MADDPASWAAFDALPTFAAMRETAESATCPPAFVDWAIARDRDYLLNNLLPINMALPVEARERAYFHMDSVPHRGALGRVLSYRQGAHWNALSATTQDLLQRAGLRGPRDLMSPAEWCALIARGPLGAVLAARADPTDPAVIDAILDGHPRARLTLAEADTLDAAVAARLATDPEPTVRAAIAERTDIDSSLITTLASDPDVRVRTAVARRKTIPRALHPALCRDERPVREAIARNKQLAPALLVELADRGTEKVWTHARLFEGVTLPDPPDPTADGVLGLWQATRHPRLADVVERLPDRFDTEALSGRDPDFRALPDDPRLTTALVRAFRDMAWPGRDDRYVWWRAFRRLLALNDVRAIEPLKAFVDLPPDKGVASTRKLVLRAAACAVERLSTLQPAPLDIDAVALARRLEAELPEAREEAPKSEDALLAAIWADPSDDEARAVFADWNEQHGNPRGEFISLGLQPKRTAAQRERAEKLLRKGRARWNHGFKAVCRVENIVYERGFPTHLHVDKSLLPRATWESALGPWWNTAESVWIGPKAAKWWGKALVSAHTNALRFLGFSRYDVFLAAAPHIPDGVVGLGLPAVPRADVVDAVKNLPHVRAVYLTGGSMPGLEAVDHITVVTGPFARWVERLENAI